MTAPESLRRLVKQFEQRQPANETELRRQFVDPLFAALGWDVTDNRQVGHEVRVVVDEGGKQRPKRPDYGFRIGGATRFFVETKPPHLNLKNDSRPAYQLRRYGWSGNLPVSVLTDFEEFCVYDCRIQPKPGDPADSARLRYWTYRQYADVWRELSARFSRQAVAAGSLRSWLEGERLRGATSVDQAFLGEMESWRAALAGEIALHNPRLGQRELNLLVQRTIDRIVFLRIAEDRDIEPYGRLRSAAAQGRRVYEELKLRFREADDKYNSGLFHFGAEQRDAPPDALSLTVHIPDEPLRRIISSLYFPASPYEFSVLPSDMLGQVYERFLGKVIQLDASGAVDIQDKPEVRKAGGVYYTPSYIVDYIVQNTVGALLEGKSPADAEKLRILDPACGSGSFLTGAYQYLLDWHLAYYSQQPRRWRNRIRRVVGGFVLTTAEKRRILQKNIYGVDLDQNAVEVSKLSLLLKMLEKESEATGGQTLMFAAGGRVLPDLSANVKWGNSLIGSDFYSGRQMALFDEEELLRVKPFDWESDDGFGAILRAGGFDAVIGNPPYIRIQTIRETASDTIPYYKENYIAASKGNYDIYVVFVEKGLRLLNENGLLGYILPHKFFNAKYGEPLRGLIAKGKHLKQIVHFGEEQVFDGATTYTCLLFLSRHARNEFAMKTVDSLEYWRNAKNHVEGKLSSFRATYSDWNFIVGHASDLFYKLHDMSIKLSDISKKVFQGLVTGADGVFILEAQQGSYYSSATESQHQLESGLLHPLCKGSVNMRRYRIEGISKSILFPYKIVDEKAVLLTVDEMQQQYPKSWQYLQSNKNKLESRERGKWRHDKWYAFGRSQNLNEMEQMKILTPSIANQASFTLDISDYYYFVGSGGGGGGGYGITLSQDCALSYKYVLGLLNSKTLDFVLKKISSRFRGGYYAYNKQYIAQLPIRTINFDNPADAQMHDDMVALVDDMLDLHRQLPGLAGESRRIVQARIAATDRRIDALVYRLYGLSAEEVAIVEGG